LITSRSQKDALLLPLKGGDKAGLNQHPQRIKEGDGGIKKQQLKKERRIFKGRELSAGRLPKRKEGGRKGGKKKNQLMFLSTRGGNFLFRV